MSNDLDSELSKKTTQKKLKFRRKVPNRIYTLDVCGTEVQTIQDVNGKKYVVIRRICKNLNLTFSTQLQKIKINFTCVHMNTTGYDGKNYDNIACLPVEQYEKWLSEINVKKVKPEARELLSKYQDISSKALHDFWTKGIAVATVEELEVYKKLNSIVIENKIITEENRSLKEEVKNLKEDNNCLEEEIDELEEEVGVLKNKSSWGWAARNSMKKKLLVEFYELKDKLNKIYEVLK